MNFLQIAARVAVRSDTLLMIDKAFNDKGIYPPFMRQVPGTNNYKGEIEKGYELEVTDVDVDPSMKPKMNGIQYKDLNEAIDEFAILKKMGGKLQFVPNTGTVDNIRYNIDKYEYNDVKQEESLSIEMHFSNPELTEVHMDVTTNLNGAVFKTLVLTNKNKNDKFESLANDQRWDEIASSMGVKDFDPITKIFEPASKAVENAAWVKLGPFMNKNKINEGAFFDWVRANSHSVVDGVLKLKVS